MSAELVALYESLARYQWLRRRLARAAPGTGLEMHKRLLSPATPGAGPGPGTAGLHDWLRTRVELPRRLRVLDLGCGFGATLLHLARRIPGEFLGISTSPFQVRRARREAKRLGLAECCTFRVQSFTDDLGEDFDLAISVETLFHAADLTTPLARVARALRRGGHLLLVEDMARPAAGGRDDRERQDARRLLECWSTPRLHAEVEYRRALADAGLHLEEDLDLSAQVPVRPPAAREAGRKKLARVRRLLPPGALRRLVDAFDGGLALESLYARGAMVYRSMVARRPAEAAP